MSFSEEVLTKSRTGRVEVRALESRGRYVLCKYLDPETLQLADEKRKLTLIDEKGKIYEYFLIPLKGKNRRLMVEAEKEPKGRKVWNPITRQEEEL
ncbi:MAG: hypothetical protein QXJ75_04880 [Candidatus Bathyarchaeia archaeon]